MSGRSGEELRHAALEALGEHADERARDALAHADVSVAEAVASWSGSGGPVQAHAVTLGLDARTLGAVRAVPALHDALCAALAAAIARRPGETLHDLHLRWSSGRASPAGYRDAPPAILVPSLDAALRDYLEGAGETGLARSLEGATVDASLAGELSVHLPPGGRGADAHATATMTAALRDLVGEAKARVRLR